MIKISIAKIWTKISLLTKLSMLTPPLIWLFCFENFYKLQTKIFHFFSIISVVRDIRRSMGVLFRVSDAQGDFTAWAAFFKSLIVMHCVISSLPQTHCPIDNVVEFILSTYTALQNSLWFIAMLVSVPDQPWLFRLTWERKIFPVPIPVIVSVPKFYSAGRGTTPKMENSCEFSGTGTKFVRYWYRYFFRYQILPVPLLFSVPNFTGTGPGTFFRYHLFPLLVPVPPKKNRKFQGHLNSSFLPFVDIVMPW